MVIESLEKTYEVIRQLESDTFVSHYLCKENEDENNLRILVEIRADEVTKHLIWMITEWGEIGAFTDFSETFSYDGNVYGVFLYRKGILLKEGLEAGNWDSAFRYELGRKILEKLIVQNIPAQLAGRMLVPERILVPDGDEMPGFLYGFQDWDKAAGNHSFHSFARILLAEETEGGLYPELSDFYKLECPEISGDLMEIYKAYLLLMPAFAVLRKPEEKERVTFAERIKKHGKKIANGAKAVLGISAMIMACLAIPALWTKKIFPTIESAYLVKTLEAGSGMIEGYHGRVIIKDPENGAVLKKGRLEDGKLSGYGTEYYQSGFLRYEGEFTAGEYSGQGELYDSRGNLLYKGGFLNGLYEGSGTLYGSQGNVVYQGMFAGGRKEGEGSLFDSEGSLIYEGGFKADRLDGEGVRFKDGQAVENGEYADGLLLAGKGFFYDEKGLVCYEGDVLEGMKQGEGIAYEKGKMVYEGSFSRNRYEGSGRLYSAETGDLIYAGEFEQGLYCGEGTLYEPGTGYVRYQGNFRKGSYDGAGLEYDASGNLMYEGNFRLGVYNGDGIFYDTYTGIPLMEGIFRNGMLVTSKKELEALKEEKTEGEETKGAAEITEAVEVTETAEAAQAAEVAETTEATQESEVTETTKTAEEGKTGDEGEEDSMVAAEKG